MQKPSCIAMLLAGGQGSRLGGLTRNIAKPAVPFGGKYRIIDFALSNCYNSGVYTVGVLTQYQPLELHRYIGIGSPWDLDRQHGGVYILPPYAREGGADWYKGTADALYQNIKFVDSMNPDHVAVLSGDHVYKMDYAQMLSFHIKKNADVTIAVINVDIKEANRFGIMCADRDGRITAFAEKPKNPQSTLASMGVYIFHWQVLRRYLIEDSQNMKSSHDFGKDIIPRMLLKKEKLFAYPFEGYWRDVGTVESYWQASMDLLGDDYAFDLYSPDWIISSENLALPPHYISKEGRVVKSLVSEACVVHGSVENSILFPSVTVEEGAVVKNSVIMAESRISMGAVVERAIIGYKVFVMQKQKILPDGPDDIVLHFSGGEKLDEG
ncbi:MAG: glucose-1-phosphate adenylyltransferase [Acidaminococcales bacterium]|nr:glucose-1-phosphate adenylyltransferase [Acidaminococcales bacterium]